MLFYIRHGHDEYDDATHRHDHKLTSKGAKKARSLAHKLIKKYGQPDIIHVSPFQRTIGTVQAMLKSRLMGKPKIIIDTDLSRVFSRTEQKDPSIAKDTKNYGIPINETAQQREQRVLSHLGKIDKAKYLEKGLKVWFITHTLIMKNVAHYLKIDVPDRFSFLTWFTVTKKHKTKVAKD